MIRMTIPTGLPLASEGFGDQQPVRNLPSGVAKLKLLSTSEWGEPAHRETIDQSNVTTRVTVNGKENSNKSIEYSGRTNNESDKSYVSNLREENLSVAGCRNGILPLPSNSMNNVWKYRNSWDPNGLPTTRSRTSLEKNVISYKHLKDDKP